ncbi:c-type cytochrome biogenesis protein CcmI [Cellvibrio sp. PSBB023]|jgi:cytochrome c-type biogenesis protein CcmH|uniref:c-type cytochrome biogenesis protein CcmI n=1 Tax=Cellvibrio sp. PSBB023 TaxID=1945512 RepID=UPI00099017DF|nr:c-type cytochrome biogenesis protein CcmI [Cellvibrio sp. PSBB023]AQT59493.1 c-type cytochrome biogenesis protein CcmI [Cellvibrio sp. PSBB023]
MVALWVGAVALCVVAALFIFWPLWRYGAQKNNISVIDVDARLAENVRLFHEHIAELETHLAAGRIDAEQFAQLKLEQERALLDDEANIRAAQQTRRLNVGVATFAVVAVVAVLSTYVLYRELGSSADVEIRIAQLEKQYLDNRDYQIGKDPDPARTREMISLIEERLEDNPDQLQYWFLLARMYMDVSDFGKATNAYLQVLERDKESAMVMAEAAQAMFLRDGSKINPAAADLVHKALKVEPDNTMALGLAGIEAFGKQNYLDAIKYWGRTVKLTGADSPGGQALVAGIERAAGLFFANGGTQEQLDAARDGRHIAVNVLLASDVKVGPDQLVFVYARAWQGAKMPLAIARFKVSELPKRVVLTESMAMTDSMTLATVDKVELVARVSQDGTATAKAGDWQGSIGPIDSAAAPADLQITIGEQVAP